MDVIHKITMDLTKPRRVVVNAVQNDNTRVIELTVLANGSAFDVSDGLSQGESLLKYVEFYKPDGFGGLYDQTELGVSAVVLKPGTNNVWLVAVDGQCCACPGWTHLNVRFVTSAGRVLHSFAIMLKVEQCASPNLDSTDWSHGATSYAVANTVPVGASVSSGGLISFINSSSQLLFTLQLPVYSGSTE